MEAQARCSSWPCLLWRRLPRPVCSSTDLSSLPLCLSYCAAGPASPCSAASLHESTAQSVKHLGTLAAAIQQTQRLELFVAACPRSFAPFAGESHRRQLRALSAARTNCCTRWRRQSCGKTATTGRQEARMSGMASDSRRFEVGPGRVRLPTGSPVAFGATRAQSAKREDC